MSKENEDENIDEKSDLDRFESISRRGPKKNIYEHTQGSLIVQATTTNNPLIKIMKIGEAAFNSKKSDKLDLSLVERLYSVAQSFNDTTPDLDKKYLMRVNWGFPQTKENFETHIQPWHRISVRFCSLETPYRYKNYPPKERYNTDCMNVWEINEERNRVLDELDELKEYIRNKIGEMPEHEKFYEISYALSVNSFKKLQAEFTRWSLMQLRETRNNLLDEISPDVWKDLTRSREEGEGVDADSLDQR